jgi:hypothetical protein
MSHDNPANRLLSILEAGGKLNKKTVCREAWGSLLDASGNSALLMSRLGKLMELPALIIESLKDNYPNRGNTWAHWEVQVNRAFTTQNLDGHWETFINHIDGTSLTLLRLSSDLIEAKSPQETLSEEGLAGLRLKLTELAEDILASDLDHDLKKYLVRALRRLVNAIDEYQITGGAEILDAVEATIGHAAVSPAYREFMKDNDLGAKFVMTLSLMANAVTVAPALKELASSVAGLLTK